MASNKELPKPKHPSKQLIKCGHCNTSMRSDRLASHTKKKHPGLRKKEGGIQCQNLMEMLSRHDRSDPKLKPTATRATDAGNEQGGKRKCGDINGEFNHEIGKQPVARVQPVRDNLISDVFRVSNLIFQHHILFSMQ